MFGFGVGKREMRSIKMEKGRKREREWK